jgi:hypothetical protein
MVMPNIERLLARLDNKGVINLLFHIRKPIRMVRATSFRNEVFEVIGMQSPKQPQLAGLPVM